MIIESKVLRPADCDISPRENPIVWFSANQFWELTANKGIIDGGIRRTATMEEMARYGAGLFRFGISEERLIRWPRIGELANIEANMRGVLMKAGRVLGANPVEWFGTLEEIPLDELQIETMLPDGRWVDFPVNQEVL